MTPRRTDRRALFLGAALAAFAAGGAFAQADIRFDVERTGGVTRLELIYPESDGGDLTASAEIAAGAVLVARLSEAAAGNAQSLVEAAPGLIARARLDPDGRTLRLALNGEVNPRVSVSHNIIAIDLMAPGASPLPDVVSPYEQAARAAAAERARREAEAAEIAARPDPALPVEIRAGQASEYTRIELVWPQPVAYTLEQDGETARLSFARAADTDLRDLLATPPRLVEVLRETGDAYGFELEFELVPGARAQAWDEGGRVVLDIIDPLGTGPVALLTALADYADAQEMAAAQDTSAQDSSAQDGPAALAPPAQSGLPAEPEIEVIAEQVRPDPVPPSGIVRATVRGSGADLALTFDWAHLPGAAVFRRAGSIWLVFDAAAELDLSEMSTANRRLVQGFDVYRGEDYSAIRFQAPASTLADFGAAGSAWTLRFVQSLDEPPRAARLTPETRYNAPSRINIALEGVRSVRTVTDPVVGDELLVVTADGEKRGIITERRLVEAVFLTSVHGIAIEPQADDLMIERVAGGARLSRPGGLALSRGADPSIGQRSARPVSPAFLDFAGWRGEGSYRQTRRRLEARASSFEPEALLALARFYLSWELASEALGVSALAIEARPQLASSPEVRTLRGAASYMLGRTGDARAYLTDPVLQNEAAVQPWLGLAAAKEGRWADARRHFEAGADMMFFFTPDWQARVHAAQARAAVETNDIGAARALLDTLQNEPGDPRIAAEAEFARARLAAATGDVDGAIERFEALGRHEWEPIQARSLLEKVRLEIGQGRITPTEGAEALESLRYRWRGDSTEIETARLLGELYAQAGRYGEALRVWEIARQRHPDSAIVRAMGQDMDGLFRRLYLENEADRMDPLDALALWYEYDYLTPQGEEGDRLVRRIASRLEAVDLLDQAAALLAHQIESRNSITGYAKAQIAVDLARLYLTADRPEDALRTIQRTRIANLMPETVEARRLLEARALADLGRQEHALELIAGEASREAEILRASIAWDLRDWAGAGRRFETVRADRWRNPEPLDGGEAHDILRAAIGYALAGDTASVERLEARYARLMGETAFGSAFSVVTSQVGSAGDARLVDLVSDLAAMEDVDSFLSGFERRFQSGEPEAGPS